MFSLQVDNISKRYRIRQEESDEDGWTGKLRRWMGKKSEFWAVRNVKFEVAHGEAIGIIGPNGAGKSTLLKILASITAPTEGEISVRGKISALLEVGSGFHPELTGRENVFLSGTILGMKRKEISNKLDRIIDFAEIGPFIDVPVKRYSSGMIVRLGFSIAAHLEPDILLLDEVLAVGDVAFQKKCFDRILELKRKTTVVFISHDLGAVQRLCDRVIVMHHGNHIYDGPTQGAIATYNDVARFRASTKRAEETAKVKDAEILSLDFFDADGQPAHVVKTGYPLRIRLQYLVRTKLKASRLAVFFFGPDGSLYCQFTTRLSGGALDLTPGRGAIEFTCDELGLQPGSYLIDAKIEQYEGDPIDWQYRCSTLQVNSGKDVRGSFYHPHSWHPIPLNGSATDV
jgi:lipopolysaccharide transport system ATP-binding protein